MTELYFLETMNIISEFRCRHCKPLLDDLAAKRRKALKENDQSGFKDYVYKAGVLE